MLIPSLISLKPTSIATERNPSVPITVRIETWVSRQRQSYSNANSAELGDTIIFAPVGADLRFQDRFFTGGHLYEILHKLPQTADSGMDQFTAIIRD